MSTSMMIAAMADRRFSKAKRLCWLAFADTDGTVSIRAVMWWVNCDEEEARRLIDWFVRKGHAFAVPGGDLYVPELMDGANCATCNLSNGGRTVSDWEAGHA